MYLAGVKVRFNHGKGYVIGHQWTNIVLVLNDLLIPLPPIPFYSKTYCRAQGLDYQSEHDAVIDYLTTLNLEDYIGSYNPREVIVLADSGYDNKKIENAIVKKQWHFIIALGKTRSVKSETLYRTTPKSRQWSQIAEFFRHHRLNELCTPLIKNKYLPTLSISEDERKIRRCFLSLIPRHPIRNCAFSIRCKSQFFPLTMRCLGGDAQRMGLLDNYRIKKSIHKLLSLRSPKDPEMTRVVEQLQQIGEPVIPYLVDALNASHNRENAVAALVTFVNNNTIPMFLSVLLSATPRVAEGLLNALTHADDYDPNPLFSLFATPKLPEASLEKLFLRHKALLQPQALLQVLPTAPKQNHPAILRLVEHIATEDIVPELLHHLHTDDRAVRLSIVRILCRFKTGVVQESLVRLLSDPYKPIRLLALEGLVAMNAMFDTEPLCRLLSDPDVAVQRQALDVLLRMMLDESEMTRQRAVDGLNTVGSAAILKQIFSALKGQEWWITLRIADALGMHSGPKLVESVLKLLNDQDRFLSQCAFEVIHTLKDEQAIAALITTLQDNEIRDRVASAIAALGDKRAVPLVLRMLERDAAAVLVATRILVALKEPQAIPPLLEQLLSADKTLVKEILRALAVLTNAEYAPEVLQSVMAIRDNAEEDIKELANKMATTIIKRFGRQVLPHNVQERSTADMPAPNGRTPVRSADASGETASPLSTSSTVKPGATLNIALLEPGMLLADRYRIIRHIGEGGFSTVLLVDDTMVHEDVILKILNPQVAMGDEMVKRFIQELRYARKVTHENVIRIYDILAIGRSYAISMEYFTSHTLADEVQNETPLNIKRGIKIIFDVCRGISAAHQVDIVHRDLKPLNILINDQGLVKVVDFGVAAVANQMGTRLTRVGTLLGTPAYVAPEQVRSRAIDARTDIYSLGVVMYEVFTGTPPYNGDDMSILFQHVEGNLTPPRSVNSEIPEALDAIIRKAMAVDPDRRFQSMDELRKSLVTFSRQLT